MIFLEILDWNKVSDSKKNGYKGVNPMTHLNQKMKSKPIIVSPVASLGIHDHGFLIKIFYKSLGSKPIMYSVALQNP